MNEETAQLGPSYDGTVMLDIGGEWGALIVTTPAELLLEEIEISAVDDELANVPVSQEKAEQLDAHDAHGHDHGHDHAHGDGHSHDDEHGHSHVRVNHPHRTHVAVRERRGPGGLRYAAIYPSLHEGEYHLWDLDRQRPKTTVRIVGGEVAQIDWA